MDGPADRRTETVGSLRRRLAAMLRGAGIETPELDARHLVGHVLDLDLTGVVLRADEPVDAGRIETVMRLAAERIARKPVGRILGTRGFYGLEFALSAETLEPRPDTETLVDAALEFLYNECTGRPIIADIGSGTGAILIALLVDVTGGAGVAVDISAGALTTTRANANRHGVADRMLAVQASYAGALAIDCFDLIVANPPYIRTGDIAGLDAEVRDYDPLLALDGGADGLDAYRALVPQAFAALKPGGALMVEIGYDQSEAVVALMRETGLAAVSTRCDLAGRARIVAGRRRRSTENAAQPGNS
ncbi:MAG: peptide chain release factor N(5)-glutamine methyltransferase [Ancalomicrobiaceae bacterium]|nr:peptide chain release factor N(5)-glutamine methyltransferase [Ancalomicrobiaceae bacterium]